MTKRYIKLPMLVKPYHTVEIRSVEKQKVQRISVSVELIPHFSVICCPLLFQFSTMKLQKVSYVLIRNGTVLYSLIKSDNIWILILRGKIKCNNTCANKRFYPNTVLVPLHFFRNQRNEFRFDSLTLDRRNNNFLIIHLYIFLITEMQPIDRDSCTQQQPFYVFPLVDRCFHYNIQLKNFNRA